MLLLFTDAYEQELKPVGATQSSYYYGNKSAASCIDGKEWTHCRTNRERAPWIALDFGTSVTVGKVKISNGWEKRFGWMRTRRVVVRISDKLPTSGSHMFSGGTVLGRFEGGPNADTFWKWATISGQKLL